MLTRVGDFLERPAGEVGIGFGLMAFGWAMWAFGVPKGEDAIVAGLTLIGRGIVGKRENKAQ